VLRATPPPNVDDDKGTMGKRPRRRGRRGRGRTKKLGGPPGAGDEDDS
jgi:hypothetical protein